MKVLLTLLSVLFVTVLFGQDSASVTIPISGGIADWIANHLGTVITILLAVYEVAARLIPTIKNYSIISIVVSILNQLVPNKKAIPNSELTTKHKD
jgi:hypothetical protein